MISGDRPRRSRYGPLAPPATRIERICLKATSHNFGQSVYDVVELADGVVEVRLPSWPRLREAQIALDNAGYNTEDLTDRVPDIWLRVSKPEAARTASPGSTDRTVAAPLAPSSPAATAMLEESGYVCPTCLAVYERDDQWLEHVEMCSDHYECTMSEHLLAPLQNRDGVCGLVRFSRCPVCRDVLVDVGKFFPKHVPADIWEDTSGDSVLEKIRRAEARAAIRWPADPQELVSCEQPQMAGPRE